MLEGQTISHYRILGHIGSGAMGVVCKAEDLLLNRIVAIKSLSAHLLSNPSSRQRLLQEARAASQLDHPNIGRIHDVQELQDGQIVLVLSFYEGDPLSAHIARGPLELARALRFQSQLLSALEHAHGHGVIHRDIKPSNVIITPSEELKVVDFGLAKGSGEANLHLTDTGVFMGTASYMSPEQVLCEDVDHRSDVWAAGVVLYEMLTGKLPFTGNTPYTVCDSVLRAQPPHPTQHRPDLPATIGPIVFRALARELEDRYASAAEFREQIESLQRGDTGIGTTIMLPAASASTRREKSIAVLPFTCPQNRAESDYFCDGLTDEIITGLTAVRALRVICSSSVFRLKGSTDSPRKIAHELKVRYLLRGTVWLSDKADGSRPMRVTAQLVDPQDEAVLWASKYGGTLEDVFSIQESISREIVSTLRLTLTSDEEKQIQARPLPDVHAYEYYLKAKHEILNYSREALDRALALLDQGERLVGKNALLLAAKGQVYWQFVNAGISSDPQYLQKARECSAQALALDPGSSHAQRLLGLIALQEGDTQKAVRLLKQCITTDPNDSDSLSWYCAICALSGKGHAAMPLARRITEIDPLTPIYRFIPGLVSLMSGEFDDALPAFEDAIRFDPENAMLQWARGQVLALCGRTQEAIDQFRALHELCPGHLFADLGAFLAAALEHEEPKATQTAASGTLGELAAADPHYSWALAEGYALIGHTDEALSAIQNAVDKGFLNYPMVARWDPLLASLRGTPRFTEFLRNMRARWEAFEVG